MLSIGDVAAQTGLTSKAIRLYESRSLIPAPERSAAGYRSYTEHHVALLRFIQQARALGLALGEIEQILDIQRSGGQPCGRVLELLDQHIADIDRTISGLRELRATLVGARRTTRINRRNGAPVVVCRLIEV